ncbi:MAG: hypothetical protein ACLGH2_13025 [Gammaproteobacteria bacterium]
MSQAAVRSLLLSSLTFACLTAVQAQSLSPSLPDAPKPPKPSLPTSPAAPKVVKAPKQPDTALPATTRVTPAQPASLSTELAKAGLAQQGNLSPTADQVAAASANVQSMRASGMGWGAIANSLGVRLGDVVSGLNRSPRATQVQEAKAQRLSAPGPVSGELDAASTSPGKGLGLTRRDGSDVGSMGQGGQSVGKGNGNDNGASSAGGRQGGTSAGGGNGASSGGGKGNGGGNAGGRGGAGGGNGNNGGGKGGGNGGGNGGGKR